MKYICKIKINDGRKEIIPYFRITLYYKKSDKIFSKYTNVVLYRMKGYNFCEDKLLKKLKELNKMNDNSFINSIKEIILKIEKENIDELNKNKSINNEIKKLKTSTKKFNKFIIEI